LSPPHLHVVKTREKPSEGTRVDFRITRGGFVADLVMDRHTDPPIWHCVIQRNGCPEIVYWAQEPTLRHAQIAAEDKLRDLVKRKREKKAQAGH